MEPHQDKSNEAETRNTEEDPPWFSDPKYDRYWAHYNHMREWMHAQQSPQTYASNSGTNLWMQSYHQYYLQHQWWMYHQHMSQRPTPSHHPSSGYGQYFPQDSANWQTFSEYPVRTQNRHQDRERCLHHHHHHHPYKPHPAASGYRGNKPYVTDQSDVDYLDNGFSETQLEDEEDDVVRYGGRREEEKEEEEFEVELSEEMRQFFLQSQKHREELKELRDALDKKKELEDEAENRETEEREMKSSGEDIEDEFVMSFMSSKKGKKKPIAGAPREQPGKRRAEGMKVLYGKDSPAIHGMETAIQMQFDRNCDKKQPAFWPTVPLKM